VKAQESTAAEKVRVITDPETGCTTITRERDPWWLRLLARLLDRVVP
jgi:hypothetical protein